MADDDRTAIGVDLGEYNLYTACPAETADCQDAYAVPGDELCVRLDELRAQTARLLGSEYDRDTIVAYVEQRRDDLLADVDIAVHEICGYADAYDEPVLVTEARHYRPDLWAWLTDPNAHRGTAWLLATAHLRLRTIAAEYGIVVETVPAAYSSQECYACGIIGERYPNDTLWCSNPECPVDTVDADHNAAKVLALRYVPGRRCDYWPPDCHVTDVRRALVADGGERRDRD